MNAQELRNVEANLAKLGLVIVTKVELEGLREEIKDLRKEVKSAWQKIHYLKGKWIEYYNKFYGK